jgi:rare lipoprotein A
MKRITLVLVVLSAAALVFAQTEVRTGEINQGIFHQEGIASWYGAEFEGRPTASGEIFNTSLFTAAHPILPFGTMLKVTNTHNSKTVIVKVNDRGPFVAARIIDLSRAAAQEIDMISTGTAPVIIESLEVVSLSAKPENTAQGAKPIAQSAIPQTAPATASQPVQDPAAQTSPGQASAPHYPAQPGGIVPGGTVQVRPASVEPYSTMTGAAGTVPVPNAAAANVPASPAGTWAAGTTQFRPAVPDSETGKSYSIQVGAYKTPKYAVEAFEKLRNAGLNPVYERHDDFYRVVLTGIKSEELRTLSVKLGGAGFGEALLREER